MVCNETMEDNLARMSYTIKICKCLIYSSREVYLIGDYKRLKNEISPLINLNNFSVTLYCRSTENGISVL